MSLRPLACWDCGFEFRRRQGCLSCVCMCMCCVLSGRGLCVGLISHPKEFPECGVSNKCDRKAPMGRQGPGIKSKSQGGGGTLSRICLGRRSDFIPNFSHIRCTLAMFRISGSRTHSKYEILIFFCYLEIVKTLLYRN